MFFKKAFFTSFFIIYLVTSSYSNSEQKLRHVDCATAISVKLIENLLRFRLRDIQAGVSQSFRELFQVQVFVPVVVDSAEASAESQDAGGASGQTQVAQLLDGIFDATGGERAAA